MFRKEDMADQLNPPCLLSLYLILGILSTLSRVTPLPSKTACFRVSWYNSSDVAMMVLSPVVEIIAKLVISSLMKRE
jgi:hypothetical protein